MYLALFCTESSKLGPPKSILQRRQFHNVKLKYMIYGILEILLSDKQDPQVT